MNPVAFHLGPLSVAWYGLLIVAGIMVGTWIGTRLARQRSLNVDLFQNMVLWAVLWGIVGARVVFVVTSWELFQGQRGLRLLYDVINIRQGGISIHGGLIAGVLVLVYFARRHRLDFYRYADLFVPAVPLGIIGGRLGNIMNGSDTLGRVTGWPDGARAFHTALCDPALPLNLAAYCQKIGGQSVMTAPVHFTQIYGVIIGVILAISAVFWMRSAVPGWAFWQFWLWYSVLRAGWEETFRLNPLPLEGLPLGGTGPRRYRAVHRDAAPEYPADRSIDCHAGATETAKRASTAAA